MKIKWSHIFRIVLGVYLICIGVMLFIDVYAQQPADYVLLLCCAVFLVIVGIAYSTQFIRKWLKNAKIERDKVIAAKKAAEEEKRYNELHSSDKFRTAPMPNVETIKKRKAPVFASIVDDPDVKIVYFDEENEEKPKEINKGENETVVQPDLTISEEATSESVMNLSESMEKKDDKPNEETVQEESSLAINITQDNIIEETEMESTKEDNLAINIEEKEEEN